MGGARGVGFWGPMGSSLFHAHRMRATFPLTSERCGVIWDARAHPLPPNVCLFVVALNPSFAGNLHHPSAASAHSSTLLRKIEESSQAQVCMITNSRYREEEEEEEEEG